MQDSDDAVSGGVLWIVGPPGMLAGSVQRGEEQLLYPATSAMTQEGPSSSVVKIMVIITSARPVNRG